MKRYHAERRARGEPIGLCSPDAMARSKETRKRLSEERKAAGLPRRSQRRTLDILRHVACFPGFYRGDRYDHRLGKAIGYENFLRASSEIG